MKQRLTALLLLVGVVGLLAFDRVEPHFVAQRASVSAVHPVLELPTTIAATPVLFAVASQSFVLAAPTELVDTLRSAPLYLRNRHLLL